MTSSLLSSFARRACPAALALLVLSTSPHAGAQVLDAAAAREHLTQGYKLKQAGQLRDALPHFVESLRLDPKLKTFINLADCEERLGMLVEAEAHWVAARDKAVREDDPRVKQEAQQRIAALDQRMPRLSIQLAAGVPSDAQIYRDEVLMGRVSIGTPLPTNPGEHKIVVRAPGHEDWKFSLKLSERDRQVVNANVGPASKSPPKPPEPAADPVPAAGAAPATTPPVAAPVAPTEGVARSDTSPGRAEGSSGTVQRVLAIVTGGLGVASFGVAGLYWMKASTDIKPPTNDRKLAQQDLLITNVSVVSGSVLVTAGIVLWLTAPSHPAATAKARWAPSLALSHDTAVIGAAGVF